MSKKDREKEIYEFAPELWELAKGAAQAIIEQAEQDGTLDGYGGHPPEDHHGGQHAQIDIGVTENGEKKWYSFKLNAQKKYDDD